MDSFGYSRRHLQRMALQQVGCNMKTIQKIQRINKAIALLKQTKYVLTEIAQVCAYYDQAHFIHEFRSVCQIPRSNIAYSCWIIIMKHLSFK